MRSKLLLLIVTAITLLSFPGSNFAQAPTLGTAANFVLFSSNGAVTNSGISQLTGNVGTNSGSSTGFGNVNGGMHDNDSASAKAKTDLLAAYNQLNGTTATFFPASALGNGDTLIAGVYKIAAAATLNGNLYLNAKGNASAVFIIQIQGSLSAAANSKIKLLNGALACNVFWKVEGLVSMATGTTMRGTIIANNAAINMNSGDTLEGRALSTTGAVTLNGTMAYTPIGCGSPTLNGPTAPTLGTTTCYALFTSNGGLSNTGTTTVTGDVGTNVGLTTGFDTLKVTGKVHPIPDGSTSQAKSDLLTAYTYLNILAADIELLYPAQFGRNLVLTPHTYILKGATTFTDTLFLNGLGNSNAVFVIQINGALSTSTYSKVVLTNGTQAKNVYWKVDGAVSINDYSVFNGTIIANNGSIDIKQGVTLNGRALTTNGAFTTAAITAIITGTCGGTGAPTITGTTPGSTCGSGAVTLGATASAGTINWYANSTGGTSLGTGTSFTTPTISATTTYYVDATQGTSTSTPRVAVIATVNANLPTITGTTPGSTCGSGPVTLGATASTGIISWYANSTGGVALGTGTSFTTPSITVTTTYYASATSGSCTSASRTAVIATVNTTLPTITGTTPGSTCGPGTVILGATASTGIINWYANSTGGASLGTGTGFTTPVISVTTTYYVDATSGTCNSSARTAVIATVSTTLPTITGTTPGSSCGPGPVTLGATSSAGIINWYANSTGGVSLATGTSFITPVISATTTYYVSATSGTCTSASRTAVIATVNTTPPSITATTPGSTCNAGPVVLGATASAGTINWYANATGGASIGTGTTFSTPSISVNTTYYVDASSGSCITATRTAVVATVNAVPTITAVSPSFTSGPGTVNLGATASAGTINWYAASTGGTSLATGISFITPVISVTTTYYVDATVGTCTTPQRSAVIAMVTPTGIASVSAANTMVSIYPNPFSTSATIMINDAAQINNASVSLRIFNVFGAEVMNASITKQVTDLETGNLPSGVYFYVISGNNNIIQAGRLVSQQ